MEMDLITEVGQYGAMGLWTLSLLYNNSQMRKDFQNRYDRLNREILDCVKDIHSHIEVGFRDMRERHNEERIRERISNEIS